MRRFTLDQAGPCGSAVGGVSARGALWSVAALTVVGLFLRFCRIGHQSLWVDELLTIQAAEVGGRMTATAFFANVQGPLHALLVHLVSALSSSEAALRSISAVASAATVPLVYALGAELADRRSGVIAAALCAFSPFCVWYAQEVRNYALLMLFAALSTLLIARLACGRARTWGGYVAATALALYSNLAGIFLATGHGVFVLAGGGGGRVRRNWFRAAVLIAMLFIPSAWGLARWTQTDEVGGRVAVVPLAEEAALLRGATTFTPMAFPHALYVMCYGYSLGPGAVELHTKRPLEAYLTHAWVVLPAAVAAAVAALLGLRALGVRRESLGLALAGLLVPALGVAATAFFNIKPLNARYLSVSYPVLVVLCASGVGMLRRTPAVALGCVLFGFSGVSLWNYYARPEYSREDVRGAARYVEARELPGDVVLVPVVKDVFEHYYDGSSDLRVIYPGQASSDTEVARRVAGAAEGHERLWFVESRLWRTDPQGRIPAYLDGSHARVEETGLAGVRVKLYDVRSGRREIASPGRE